MKKKTLPEKILSNIDFKIYLHQYKLPYESEVSYQPNDAFDISIRFKRPLSKREIFMLMTDRIRGNYGGPIAAAKEFRDSDISLRSYGPDITSTMETIPGSKRLDYKETTLTPISPGYSELKVMYAPRIQREIEKKEEGLE